MCYLKPHSGITILTIIRVVIISIGSPAVTVHICMPATFQFIKIHTHKETVMSLLGAANSSLPNVCGQGLMSLHLSSARHKDTTHSCVHKDVRFLVGWYLGRSLWVVSV